MSSCYQRLHLKADKLSKDSINTSNPFTNLSNVVSGLTTIGHLDVYSLSRESLQRMLPESTSRDSPAGNSTPAVRPPPDTRQFQYRFSMTYIRSLPEGQRPVEREIFGMPFFYRAWHHLTSRTVPYTSISTMESFWCFRSQLPEH